MLAEAVSYLQLYIYVYTYPLFTIFGRSRRQTQDIYAQRVFHPSTCRRLPWTQECGCWDLTRVRRGTARFVGQQRRLTVAVNNEEWPMTIDIDWHGITCGIMNPGMNPYESIWIQRDRSATVSVICSPRPSSRLQLLATDISRLRQVPLGGAKSPFIVLLDRETMRNQIQFECICEILWASTQIKIT